MRNFLAQTSIPLFPPGGKLEGIGPLGLEGKDLLEAPQVFDRVISTIVGIMTVIAVIWFIIQFLIGAIGIISSGGDKAKLTEARSKITSGIIGLVVTIAALFLIDLIGGFIGLDILGGVSKAITRLMIQ